jgi:RHS repeat-associated protein
VLQFRADAAGNLTAAPGAAFAYNAAEQMTSATVGGSAIAHVYAGSNQVELNSAAGNHFVYGRNDQQGQPWLQSHGSRQRRRLCRTRWPGHPLGLGSAANDYTAILDGLGSVVAVVATDGTIAAQYTYDPYGVTVSATETGLNQPNVVRYAGGIYDETTGLTKFGKRFYDSTLGRFAQADSLNLLGNPSHGNRYAYAAANPVNNTDPNGAVSFTIGGCYGLVIGGCGGISYDPVVKCARRFGWFRPDYRPRRLVHDQPGWCFLASTA